MARLHEKKEKSTAEKAVDEKSRILLFKLLNNGSLDSINGVIATGKESVVIHGKGENLEKSIPMCEVAIKVFKTTITEFHNRIQYIIGDPILQQTGKLSKQNPKLTIPLWAEKEMHNLVCVEFAFLDTFVYNLTFLESNEKVWNRLPGGFVLEETHPGYVFYRWRWPTSSHFESGGWFRRGFQENLGQNRRTYGETLQRLPVDSRWPEWIQPFVVSE